MTVPSSSERNVELDHSHKKWKDSLEGSLDRVLLAAELEFPKILVPRLPQHTSDVNIECAGKSESSNVNEVIRAVLNSLFFFTKRFYTHILTKDVKTANKVLTSYVSLVHIYKRIVGSEDVIFCLYILCFISY